MVGTSHTRSSVDIRATVQKHDEEISSVLETHVLTGCDTVSYLWGIGKGTVVNNLKKGYQLTKLGVLQTDILDVISEATLFFAGCYGSKTKEGMTKIRFDVWSQSSLQPQSSRLFHRPQLRSVHMYTGHMYKLQYGVRRWKLTHQWSNSHMVG